MSDRESEEGALARPVVAAVDPSTARPAATPHHGMVVPRVMGKLQEFNPKSDNISSY